MSTDLVAIGMKVPDRLHRRIVRVRSTLEYASGTRYGMGKLMARMIEIGLASFERDLNLSELTDTESTEDTPVRRGPGRPRKMQTEHSHEKA